MFFILLAVFLASFVGTITGFGTSTILIPLLSLKYPFIEVLLFVGVIHWFGNLWKMYFFRKGASLFMLGSFGVFGVIASYLGANLTFSVPEETIKQLLGAFLAGYSFLSFVNPKLKLKNNYLNASIGGILSGLTAGFFGVGGVVRGAFLTAFGLKKATYLFTAGFLGLFIDSSRLFSYWNNGALLENLGSTTLVISILVSLVGAWIAKRVIDYIPEKGFRYVVLFALLLLGLYYLLL